MRTEYNFTTAQKAELKRIDDEIARLNNQIIDLYVQKSNIYLHAECRYIFDKEEVPSMDKLIAAGLFDKPLIQKQGIVKMIDVDE